MSILLILEVVFAFGFMIAIHEWGHFIACRLFGVRVERFAIGFGPTLWSKKIGGTEYAVLAIPLGGYCKPAGGDLSGENPEKMYEAPPKTGEFLWAAWWKRVVIFLAGPCMNYLSAVVLVALVLMIGEKVPVQDPILGFVPKASLAEQAGLMAGDRILKLDGKAVDNFFDDLDPLYTKLSGTTAASVTLEIDRKGKTLQKVMTGLITKDGPTVGLYPATPAVIGSVALMTPARKAGVEAGDRVKSVNGQSVSDWNELASLIRGASGDAVTLDVDRSGRDEAFTLQRVDNGLYKAIGISPVDPPRSELKRFGFLESCKMSVLTTANMTVTFSKSLFKLFTGQISLKDNLAGPVTIVRTMYERASKGIVEFLNIVAFISLILCLMNLLPIPVVDGGQIVLCFLEGVRRRPMSVGFQLRYQQVGFFLVVALMVLAVFNDFWGLIQEIKNHHP